MEGGPLSAGLMVAVAAIRPNAFSLISYHVFILGEIHLWVPAATKRGLFTGTRKMFSSVPSEHPPDPSSASWARAAGSLVNIH